MTIAQSQAALIRFEAGNVSGDTMVDVLQLELDLQVPAQLHLHSCPGRVVDRVVARILIVNFGDAGVDSGLQKWSQSMLYPQSNTLLRQVGLMHIRI